METDKQVNIELLSQWTLWDWVSQFTENCETALTPGIPCIPCIPVLWNFAEIVNIGQLPLVWCWSERVWIHNIELMVRLRTFLGLPFEGVFKCLQKSLFEYLSSSSSLSLSSSWFILLVISCFLITVIKCLKGQKLHQWSLFEGVL